MTTLKIISPITHHTTGSKNLKKSLLKFGYDFEFIGVGSKWVNFIENKIKTVLNHLISVKNSDSLYCIIDGYDMIACNYPKLLIEKFKAHTSPIIFGGEKYCFRYNGIPIDRYKNASFFSSRKYLNTGFVIGEKESLIKMYKWCIKQAEKLHITDDQKIACMFANAHPTLVSVDLYQTMVFNTITEVDKNNFTNDKDGLYIKAYNSFPCFIHFPSIKSDGYERYNNYSKAVLGSAFLPQYGNKSWNFFANIHLYSSLVLLLIYILFKLKLIYLFPFLLYLLKLQIYM
jgi:hypothetical protein